jgi:leucine dehydrogenase
MARGGHDRVIAVQHEASGLRAWIALHHLGYGPAYGGIRVLSYRTENDALHDALRLSRAMTLKCVLAGVKGGGGKVVVMAQHLINRVEAMKQLGREVEALGGVYQTGPDAGFTAADGEALRSTTVHTAQFFSGGKLRSGGEATAEGVMQGVRAALDFLGTPEMQGITVAIQGLGSVGMAVAKLCLQAGARVIGADINEEVATTAAALGVEIVAPAKILEVPCDVLAPAALGGTIHDLSIARMETRIVAGVANNVLGHAQQAELLRQRGIIFLPDFVLNAGALIEGSGFLVSGREDWSEELRGIGTTITEILRRAQREQSSTLAIAETMALELV